VLFAQAEVATSGFSKQITNQRCTGSFGVLQQTEKKQTTNKQSTCCWTGPANCRRSAKEKYKHCYCSVGYLLLQKFTESTLKQQAVLNRFKRSYREIKTISMSESWTSPRDARSKLDQSKKSRIKHKLK
jgi:hypothetical protein